MNSTIEKVFAREILDSRGNPTVEVDIYTESGHMGRASVPSGASTGEHEAIELRDNDLKRYHGKGVKKAINNINDTIASSIKGLNVTNQSDLDRFLIELDGTENKSRLGANALLGVSIAASYAGSKIKQIPLYRYISNNDFYTMPVPMMNIINGGSHADNSVDIQEFMVIPFGANSFAEALRMGTEIFHNLKLILKSKSLITAVGDEGGFAPDLRSNVETLEIILESINKTGLNPGIDVDIALDVAASEIYSDNKYVLKSENKILDSEDMVFYLKDLVRQYPIISIEDGLSENDWEGWNHLNSEIGDQVQIVGDDLTVTNKDRLQRSIDEKSINAILIKLNQIGTVTETIDAIKLAQENNLGAIISHRSGETEDTTIADLSVSMGMGQIKTGSASRTDRLCKYNQLLRIEEELKFNSNLANRSFLGHRQLTETN